MVVIMEIGPEKNEQSELVEVNPNTYQKIGRETGKQV
jgi:hypothetical protein